MSDDSTPLLKVSGLSKRFGSVQALADVSFELRAGEIHSLLGENGAGKSTTIKCITGVHRAETGTVELNGRVIAPRSPREAELIGIGTVYQEVNLLPNLTVMENIVLGRVKTKAFGKIDWKDARQRAKSALSKLEMDIDLDATLSTLPVAMQQLVALARALEVDSKVLILDEPTASLDEAEVENLFRVMNLLRDKGIGIVFITHFLDQVFRMSDRMTVLRNGRYIVTRDAKGLSKQDLLQDMLGKAFEEMQSRGDALDAIAAERAERAAQLEVRGLGAPGMIDSVDLELRQGEVVGLAGLLGSGRTECARLIFGVDKATTGSVGLKGRQIKQGVPSESIREGIMLASEDRKAEGIFPNLTVRENMMIALQSRRGSLRPVPREEQDAIAEKYIKAMRIKTSGPEAKIKELSGGNQQKVLLARWLAAEPKVLILDEPTRGIDIGARAEIEKLIESLSEDGLSMIMISSEMDEEVRCCHRVLVLRDRKVIGELQGSAISESEIVRKIADHE